MAFPANFAQPNPFPRVFHAYTRAFQLCAHPVMRLCSLAILLTLSLANAVHAETFSAHVIRVADGDTITVVTPADEKLRIRLRGIDAPESSQSHGPEAKKALAWLLDGADVVVNYNEKDKYGRIVGQVTAGNVDAGLYLLEGGHAWVYRSYVKKLSRDWQRAYNSAERQARSAKKGLWAEANPTPPWEYRKAAKQTAAQENVNIEQIKEKLNGWATQFISWLKNLLDSSLLGAR